MLLVVHILAGLTAVVAGVLATTAPKQPGRHHRAGTVYLYAMTVVFLTATGLTAMRWHRLWHLFVIATVGFGLAMFGWWVRRARPRRWLAWHGSAMAGSFIALLTGFYVDNGARLPGWDRLPHLLYWLIPALVGVPLTGWALRRNGAFNGSGSRGDGRRGRVEV